MTASGSASGPSILDDIRALARGKGEACATGDFVASLTPEQRAAISQARSEGIKATVIGRWLKTLGLPVTEDSAVRHITGRCACRT